KPVLHLKADGSAALVMGIHGALAYDAGVTATLNPVVVDSTNATTHELQLIPPQFNGTAHALVAIGPDVGIEVLQYLFAGFTTSLGVEAPATATADPSNACYRLLATTVLSSQVFIMGPKVALEGSISWDTFFSGDIAMERYPKVLANEKSPLYDS